MAKRIKVSSLIDDREWQGEFDDDVKADAWRDQQIRKNSWGKPERWVRVNDEDVSGAIETRTIEVLGESVVEYKMPAQYEIVEINLSVDQEYLLQQCHEKRRREYPPISEFADAFVKHMNGDSTQLEEYASKCLEIKQKHPKP